MKEYNNYEVWNLFESQSLKNKVQILHEALDLMEQYNGRGKTTCIAMGMGLEKTEDGKKWIKPKSK